MNKQNCEIIERQLCKEIDQIAENIQKNQTISSQEVDKLDKLFHALKSQATYMAMKDAEGYNEDGVSERHNRNMSGHYDQNYADGYNRGYSEAMEYSRANDSVHYPMMPHNYGPRRW